MVGPIGSTRCRLFRALALHWVEHGRFPTVREASRLIGVSSVSAVTLHLARLVEEGRLLRDGRSYRLPITEEAQRSLVEARRHALARSGIVLEDV